MKKTATEPHQKITAITSASDESLSTQLREKSDSNKHQPNQSVTDIEKALSKENGGYESEKEPTRYGDWEIAGRCVDF